MAPAPWSGLNYAVFSSQSPQRRGLHYRTGELTMPQAILIVEDEPPIATLMRELLNIQPGYQATAVPDCGAALSVLHEVVIDAIVLDLLLPGTSGLEFWDTL